MIQMRKDGAMKDGPGGYDRALDELSADVLCSVSRDGARHMAWVAFAIAALFCAGVGASMAAVWSSRGGDK